MKLCKASNDHIKAAKICRFETTHVCVRTTLMKAALINIVLTCKNIFEWKYKGVRDTKIRKQVLVKEKKEDEEEEEEGLIGIQNFLFLFKHRNIF